MNLRPGASFRRALAVCLVVPAALALPLALSLPSASASADSAGSVTFNAIINGQPTGHSSSEVPVNLYPRRATTVSLRVTNGTSRPVLIQAVNISGEVAGLSFFSFDTSVDLAVRSDHTTRLSFSLDMSSLKGQATGLIPASIKLFNVNGDVVASQSLVTKVHGSLISVYGLFGLAILILTILAVIDVFLAFARQRMPQNRWRRGLRFMTPGIGIGLVLVFSMSALGIWTPTASTWLPIAVIFAVGFFVIGYLTPTPLDVDEEDEDEDEDDEDGDVLIKVDGSSGAKRSGAQASPPPPPPPPAASPPTPTAAPPAAPATAPASAPAPATPPPAVVRPVSTVAPATSLIGDQPVPAPPGEGETPS
jgi:hypothetical protein